MVFGDDPDRAPLLVPLGKATRIYYTLRDYEADIAAGFVNIPSEAMLAHGIANGDLSDRFSRPVQAWFHEEAAVGLDLLSQHSQIMGREKFGWKGRLALNFAYTKPTRAYLEGVLAGKNLEPN